MSGKTERKELKLAAKEKRRSANYDRNMRIFDRVLPVSAKTLICHQKGSGPIESRNLGPFIKKQPMSFVSAGSRFVTLHMIQDGSFKSGGRTYERQRDGSLRVHGKPRSRVKRLREERSINLEG